MAPEDTRNLKPTFKLGLAEKAGIKAIPILDIGSAHP